MKINSNLLPFDTDKESDTKQLNTLKKMGISARAEITFQLSYNVKTIVNAGIRQRHPDYSPDEITQAALSLIIDKNTLRQAFNGREVPA